MKMFRSGTMRAYITGRLSAPKKPRTPKAEAVARDKAKWERVWNNLIERGVVWTDEQWRESIRKPEPVHLKSSIARLNEPFGITRQC